MRFSVIAVIVLLSFCSSLTSAQTVPPSLLFSRRLPNWQAADIVRDQQGFLYVGEFIGTAQNSTEIEKYDSTGQNLLASRLVQGCQGANLAIDRQSNVYLGGLADVSFVATTGAFQSSYKGHAESCVVKLNASLEVLYATWLGGDLPVSTSLVRPIDEINDIAADADGNVYLAGFTNTNFPTTDGVYNPVNPSGTDVAPFVAKLDSSGSNLVYSTYLGGAGSAWGISVDQHRNAYVTGTADNDSFPVSPGAFHTDRVYWGSVFVVKLNPDGTRASYSARFGGLGLSSGLRVAVDPFGNSYISGLTTSPDFPISQNAPLKRTPGTVGFWGDGTHLASFISKLSKDGSTLIYSTFLGGNRLIWPIRLQLDSSEHAYVTGWTDGTGFPMTGNALQSSFLGIQDAYLTKINSMGTAFSYSTYLGTDGWTNGLGLAPQADGTIWLTGWTNANSFPITFGTEWIPDVPSLGFLSRIQTTPCIFNSQDRSVTICDPVTAGRHFPAMIRIRGGTTDRVPVRVLQIYVDGMKRYEVLADEIDASLEMATGIHRITVQAVDLQRTRFKRSMLVYCNALECERTQ